MSKQEIEYKWENLWIWKFKQVRKSEWITAAELKKDFWFSTAQIKELELQWKIAFTLIWKTKYYDREDILNFL